MALQTPTMLPLPLPLSLSTSMFNMFHIELCSTRNSCTLYMPWRQLSCLAASRVIRRAREPQDESGGAESTLSFTLSLSFSDSKAHIVPYDDIMIPNMCSRNRNRHKWGKSSCMLQNCELVFSRTRICMQEVCIRIFVTTFNRLLCS